MVRSLNRFPNPQSELLKNLEKGNKKVGKLDLLKEKRKVVQAQFRIMVVL
ncbi:hypothetical protein bcere0019_57950 [Bacillus cereus Rock3-28]|nr:hypothetical protein bcere0019_57950 [Bacillus cereus Rock3-28]